MVSTLRIIFFGFLLSLTSNFGQTFFIALFSKPVRDSLSLSNVEFGMVYSLATLLSAALLLWTGPWVDRMRLSRITSISFVGLLIGVLAMAFSATHIFLLFFGMLCLRQFGQGLMGHISAATISRAFEQTRGRALSFAALGYPVGEAILPSLAILSLNYFGLQNSWLLIALLIAALYVPISKTLQKITLKKVLTAAKESSRKAALNSRQWQRNEVLRDECFWILIPMLSAPALVITALFFHQIIIAESKGWSAQMIAASFSVHAITQIGASMFSGFLIDRYGARMLLRVYLIPIIVGCLLFNTGSSTTHLWLYMGCLGLSVGAMFPVIVASLAEIYGVTHIGSIKSIVMAILVLSTAVSPVMIGALLDRNWSVDTLMSYLTAYVVVSLALGNAALELERRRC